MSKTLAFVFAIALGLSGAASAQTPLKDVEFVREGIISLGMAIELSDKCGSISPRRVRGINFLYSLRNHAFDLGYSRDQVDAYVGDKAEEERLKQIAYGRLADLGVTTGNEASYCAAGRSEIAKGSDVGPLLS